MDKAGSKPKGQGPIMHLLIPYVRLIDHPDPALDEFTYGDHGQHAKKLKSLTNGDYVFFHTTKNNRKHITAYYVVDRALDTVEACQNRAIRAKYKNPHILECLEGKRPKNGEVDVIVFGDPILSRVLEPPVLFDRKLAEKLSLNMRFPTSKTETQVIGSATRAWRRLTDRDKDLLLKIAEKQKNRLPKALLRSTEEVAETLERDLEVCIADNPTCIGRGLKLLQRQKHTGDGRLDVLFEDKQGNWVLVEVKLGRIGRDALQQIRTYIHTEREKNAGQNITGVIVCAGVMPAFEEELKKQKDIRILVYGWDLQLQQW
jgi:hypothetical protein